LTQDVGAPTKARKIIAKVLLEVCVVTADEGKIHSAGRLLRRSEAAKQMRRPASVGMTRVGDEAELE